MSFPKHFLWGGSISASQAEGAWNEDGKSPVQIDYALCGIDHSIRKIRYQLDDHSVQEGHQYMYLPAGAMYLTEENTYYPNHKGIDFYHRYEEDLNLMAGMGFNVFNTSISWARIYPQGLAGGVNPKGVAFYHKVFETCVKLGMEPVITLHKYDDPVSLEYQFGGWKNRRMIEEYVGFASFCFREFTEVKRWITFNELNILQAITTLPDTNADAQVRYTELHHQIVAAAKSVIAAKEINPMLQVGIMIAGHCIYPLTSDPQDVLAAYRMFQEQFCYCGDATLRGSYPSFAEALWKKEGVTVEVTDEDKAVMKQGTADFLAFSYYMSTTVTTHKDGGDEVSGNLSHGVRNPYLEYSDWGWAMDPTGFRYFLNVVYDRYQKPLLDVENGLGAIDTVAEDGRIHDDYRIDYHREHILAMKAAVEEGVDLFGYTTWAPIDLISFSTGEISKRYGFIYVDLDDQGNGSLKRIKKDSYDWFKKVIASNGEDVI